MAMLLCRPHRLKPVDCKFISKVAKLVPVIPVLAKADSMTSDELQAFRKQVATSLLKVRRKPICPTWYGDKELQMLPAPGNVWRS